MRDCRGCDIRLISSRLGQKSGEMLFLEKAKAVTAKDKGGKKLNGTHLFPGHV